MGGAQRFHECPANLEKVTTKQTAESDYMENLLAWLSDAGVKSVYKKLSGSAGGPPVLLRHLTVQAAHENKGVF